MTKLYPPIFYLENDNFDKVSGKLIPIVNPLIQGDILFDNLTIVLVQGDFCRYCTNFKPVFQKIANETYEYMDFATIQVDSSSRDKLTNSEISRFLNLDKISLPTLVKIYKGQVLPTKLHGEKSEEQVLDWIRNS